MQYHDRTAVRKSEYFLYGNTFCAMNNSEYLSFAIY